MDNRNLDKAMNYCSRAEHCIDDVRQKLWTWKVPVEEHDEIIESLIENNFINEVRYAEAFVKDKFRFNHWGRIKIRLMLRTKRIGAAIIDDAMSCIDDDEYIEVLKNLIEAESKKVKASSDYERKAKLLRYVAGRGFESSLASEFIF